MHDNQTLRVFNYARLKERSTAELTGLCAGALADGVITQGEAEYIFEWMNRHASFLHDPVIAVLYDRIRLMLEDNVLSAEESCELALILTDFVGGDFSTGEITKPTTIPLTAPPPALIFMDKRYCFTGTFAYGTRSTCEDLVELQGGITGGLTKTTNYLIIGTYATESWINSTYGRKIEKALALAKGGADISIVSEDHWLKFIV